MAIYPLLRPLVFTLDAERAHALTIAALKAAPIGAPPRSPPALASRVAGLDFPNPVGLAAGFDKNAEVPEKMLGLGFGFAEVGTLTPLPQPGNPKPRIFRLTADRAVINRLGFNNGGQADAAKRLARRDRTHGIVGINIGANKDSADRIADYETGVRAMAPLADYLTINISSPNTPGLRALQDEDALDALLERTVEARGDHGPPIFLKVAPDLDPADIEAIARISTARKMDGLIVGNTTISRPPLQSKLASETGGLSGRPLAPLARQRLADIRAATGSAMPIIAVGGIDSAEEAWARIRAGASLVQLYSALAYEGPGLGRRIVLGLDRLRAREGFETIGDAVGSG
ncbi:quinone-dependent dihydroorotate dehydrogenase [Parasphingopyxis algicola]|uniref:quinone-dependent dihydroorotate dehydrogenase n=1 Tax=Parasphingopyxis algicola TaxID=2026624 RepID=UPI0015A040B7|nr:quinone-dependent dihydroorotate dehydrogenase [Parasphingopyxis algicola]QLC25561.1 quinone-dependent dihydroorotate dehydrogenase [Parasphingopyxis algicola]